MTASELFQAGRLGEAIAAATDEVRRDPANTSRRGLLAELQCFAGQLEKADHQLDVLSQQDPAAAVGIAIFRQLIRAEQARQQVFAEGRLPEFLGTPCDRLKLHLEASIQIRDGLEQQGAETLARAEEMRPKPRFVSAGQDLADFRDLDDLTSSFFEVCTSTGKYYWIPMEIVEQIEFHPPKRPRDLLWRRAHMTVAAGPDGEVFLPVLYAGTHNESDDPLRLGRTTSWREPLDGLTLGVGQRMFLFGEETQGILEINELCRAATLQADQDG